MSPGNHLAGDPGATRKSPGRHPEITSGAGDPDATAATQRDVLGLTELALPVATPRLCCKPQRHATVAAVAAVLSFVQSDSLSAISVVPFLQKHGPRASAATHSGSLCVAFLGGSAMGDRGRCGSVCSQRGKGALSRHDARGGSRSHSSAAAGLCVYNGSAAFQHGPAGL